MDMTSVVVAGLILFVGAVVLVVGGAYAICACLDANSAKVEQQIKRVAESLEALVREAGAD